VESGVYIRSLGEELGKRLGCPASLVSLRRTRIGDMKVEDAEGPETIDISEV
jgi:tRNA pseudouridine55 synthase